MMKVGDMAYIVESSRVIRTGKILRENRVYCSKEAAEAVIQEKTGCSNAAAARNHMAAIFR